MGIKAIVETLTKSLAITPGGDVFSAAYGRGAYGASWPLVLPSTRVDYSVEAGSPDQNAIVVASLLWIARNFPEAPLRVLQKTDTVPEELPDHPLKFLLEQPNEYYNGLLLWQATLFSFNIDGNAYWLKQRNNNGQIAELWYEPHTTCRPTWDSDGKEFIAGYQVMRNGQWSDVIPRSEVIHFRNGIDPNNPRRGLSPLASALREIFTDNEAANFSASLLRNTGIPSMVISPGTPDGIIPDPEGLKRTMLDKFSGDKRGEPLVMQGPTHIEMLGFSPEQMNLEALRNIPEERISALLGIPAMVIGLGVGHDASRYANMVVAKAAAYDNNLLPTQRLLAAQVNSDLMPDFGDPRQQYVEFDVSGVKALADDEDALYTRVIAAYKGGLLMRSESRSRLDPDLPNEPEDDVYFTSLPVIRGNAGETDPAGTLLAGDLTDAIAGKRPGALPVPPTVPAINPPKPNLRLVKNLDGVDIKADAMEPTESKKKPTESDVTPTTPEGKEGAAKLKASFEDVMHDVFGPGK